MRYNNYFEDKLNLIKSSGLSRTFRYLETAQGSKVTIEGREVILLGSNDYLGLCNDQRLKEASYNAIDQFGCGAGGSRLTTGSYVLHKALEEALADFKGAEGSILFNSGYAANVGAISAITDSKWVVFSDKLNHASIVDGCVLSGAKMVRYKHGDMADLERKIVKFKSNHNLIITDGIFSMDGNAASLPEIVALAKAYDCMTMVDDAHGFGVLGKSGKGTVAYFAEKGEISETDIDIQMGTLSKAAGSVGGYVAGNRVLIEYLRNTARSFIFSTALPPGTLAASIKALEIIKEDEEKRKALFNKIEWFKNRLIEAGFKLTETVTPIIPILVGDPVKTMEMSNRLLEDGIYAPGIRPPTVPKGTSRLRMSVTASHSVEELEYALERIIHHGRVMNLIG